MINSNRMRELAGLPILTEKKKLAAVVTQVEPPEGLFADGSKAKIVKWLKANHPDLKSAMSALSFYINRAGKNLDVDRKEELNAAKEDLRDAFTVKEEQFATLRKWAGLPALPIVEMDDAEAEEAPKEEPKDSKDDEEAEEEIPSIVTKIAAKAEGMKGDELVDLIGKVYDAGFKDGQKEADEETDGAIDEAVKMLDFDATQKPGEQTSRPVTPEDRKALADKIKNNRAMAKSVGPRSYQKGAVSGASYHDIDKQFGANKDGKAGVAQQKAD
jgi:hypothetical protein